MIAPPPALQAALDAGATTLAWCWRVTRADGLVLGFTDHDRAIAFEGLAYAPNAGFSPGAVRDEAGAPGDAAAFGALDDERVSASDLDNGLWDGALVEIFRVDWTDPDQRWRAATREVARVTRRGRAFEAELQGLSARLERTIGRSFTRACDAELGDARCGVDLSAPGRSGDGIVVGFEAPRTLIVAGLDGLEPGRARLGRLVWTSGANAAAAARVREDRAATDGRRLELAETPGATPAPGDAFTVAAGCDKAFATCRDVYANAANFRGFPHMPGNDVLIRHPSSEQPRDGSRRGRG